MLDIFGLANMGNYESRKVERYEEGDLLVSTARVHDSCTPYETGISHPDYYEGNVIVVETYSTVEAAREGHERWVKIMTTEPLPDGLQDVGESDSAKLVDAVDGRPIHLRQKKEDSCQSTRKQSLP